MAHSFRTPPHKMNFLIFEKSKLILISWVTLGQHDMQVNAITQSSRSDKRSHERVGFQKVLAYNCNSAIFTEINSF